MSKGRIYVVEDEEPIRRASRLMLRVMQYEPRTFDGGVAFLEALPELDEGCVLLDIRMPGIDGLEVQRRLNQAEVNLPVVIMSGHGDLGVAVPAMENGAIAFVEKPFYRATLERALDLARLCLHDPPGYAAHVEAARAKVRELPELERAILELIAHGRSTHGIASELDVADAVVDVRKARLFATLGIDSATEALPFAFAAGLNPSYRN